MNKLNSNEYPDSVNYIDESGCGIVYPRSVAEKLQQGDIFANSRSALFRHYSGFAFPYGDFDKSFLDWIYETFLSDSSMSSKRFILFVSDEKVKNYFINKDNIVLGYRYFFEYRNEHSPDMPVLPSDYKLCEINKELLNKIQGRITPFFSWSSSDEFLEKGKGYCITNGENAAAWAFTAAISKDEIDIGIETNSGYQHLGLGTAAAKSMIRYSLSQHKRPVWACDSSNIASQKLAYKLGFVKSAECCTVKNKNLF